MGRTFADLARLGLCAVTGLVICAVACARSAEAPLSPVATASSRALSAPLPSASQKQEPAPNVASFPIRQVSLSTRTTCAVTESGAAYCWGDNEHSQAVPGAPSLVPLPLRLDIPEPVRQIAAGSRHSCALGESGAVYCWGVIHFRSTTSGSFIAKGPERVASLSPAVSIAVSDSHGCAVLADGSVACWGNNRSGQVGLGSVRVAYRGERPLLARPSNPPEHQPGPALVPGVRSAVSVAAGESASCALLSGGSFACWGQGFACEGPTAMPELGSGNRALAAGHGAFCWLGSDGTPNDAPPINTRAERDPACHPYDHDPRAEHRGPPGARGVACSDRIGCSDCFGCAVTHDGSLSCWQSRDARPGPVDEVLAVAREVRGVSSVAVERASICVITEQKRLLCWGWNLRGELGRGSASEFELVPAEPSWPG